MTLRRYLLHVAYLGKTFLGCQRQVSGKFPRADDPSTVQGRIETALKLLHPTNEPIIVLSSRTDAGVNALNTTMHVDLSRPNGEPYDPHCITSSLNKCFSRGGVPIQILRTYLAPEDFHCRWNAISRTYLYRLAVIKSEALNMPTHLDLIPIEEFERCLFLCTNTFDVEEMRKVAQLFMGQHDFRTFMGRGSFFPDKMTRRVVQRLEICDGRPLTYSPYSWPTCVDKDINNYRFYDIYIQGTGFVFRQVRRMVASLIAVAQGKVSSSELKLMLEVPSHRTWNDCIKTVPAYGLYLCEVEYSAGDRARLKTGL